MDLRLQKSAALIAVAVIAIGCKPGNIGAVGSPSDKLNDRAHAANSPDRTHRKRGQVPNAADERTDNKAIQSKDNVPGVAEDAETSPPGAVVGPQRPWAHNTGPSDPGAITPYTGPGTITTDGAVLENFSYTGGLTINADNVTLRNFRILVGPTIRYPLRVLRTSSGLYAEDGEISGGLSCLVYDTGNNNTFKRLYLHDNAGDGFKTDGDGVLVEGCFVEKLGTGAGAHADGVQVSSKLSRNQTYRGNNFYMPINLPGYESNAAFIFGDDEVSVNNVVEGNWLNGGNYTIYCQPGVFVRNNFFGRDYRYGPKTGSCSEWTNNRWEDTGEPI